jgi:hypothetical protein
MWVSSFTYLPEGVLGAIRAIGSSKDVVLPVLAEAIAVVLFLLKESWSA